MTGSVGAVKAIEPVQRRAKCYGPDGSPQGEVDLPAHVFGHTPNPYLIHQVVVAQAANARQGTHSTKRISEVSGSGAKLYRQKGLGRARHGSIRVPQFVGGAVAHGPKPRDYRQATPKKMVRGATVQLLSDRAASRRIRVVTDWGLGSPSTSAMARALRCLNLWGRILLLTAREEQDVYRSARNIDSLAISPAWRVSALELIKSDWIVLSKAALKELEERFHA
jgi:large subunit ribosomal protein L4